MTHEEIISKMRTAVKEYAEDVLRIPAEHIDKFTRFGANIMCAKWDIAPGLYLSGFESAIVNNDLRATFARADNDNRALIHYYVIMWNSMEFPVKQFAI